MDEIIYYQDDKIAITSREVRLGSDVYAMADVRRADVIENYQGVRLGKVKISRGLLWALVFVPIYTLTYLLLAPFFSSLETTRDFQGLYTVACAYALAFGIQWLTDWRLREAGYYTISLILSLFPHQANNYSTPDKKYLQNIAKIINHASFEYYKAQQKERTPQSRIQRNPKNKS